MKLRNLILGAASALFAVLFAGSAMAAFATGSVHVRAGPGQQYHSLNILHPGQQVNVQTCQGGWCYVTYNGPAGWVSGRYLSEQYAPPRFHPQPPVYHQYPQYPRQPSVNFSFGVPGFSFSIGNTRYRPWHQWYHGCIRQYGQIYCPVR